MKRLPWYLLWIALLATPAAVLAEDAEDAADNEEPVPGQVIYRTRDAAGNVIFTDQPPAGQAAEPIQLREHNIVPLVRPVIPSSPTEQAVEEDEGERYAVSIVAPPNGETFHNPEVIQVQAAVSPAMRKGQTLQLLDNGVPSELKLEWPDRGEHVLVVRLLDKDGKVLAESGAVTVFVHRVSLLRSAP